MEHPIGNMMQTTMENIKDMVDVNTVIGEAVSTTEGMTVIPVSKVSFGFVAGGGEYNTDENGKAHMSPGGEGGKMPFAGGSGAGVSVQPVGFLVVGNGSVKMLPAQPNTMADRMVELLPQVVEDFRGIFRGYDKHEGRQKRITIAQGNGEGRGEGRADSRDSRDGREGPGLNQMGRGSSSSYDDRM
jgi:sporulation protein YtfJ